MEAPTPDANAVNGSFQENGNVGQVKVEDGVSEVENFKRYVDEMAAKVDEFEQNVNKLAEFYSSLSKKQSNGSKGNSGLKDKDKEKLILSAKKLLQDSAKREAAATKRMQELMHQFGTIFDKITTHNWSWPFMAPVDVEGLGLKDYYEVIQKPMDFGTIRQKMEAKDGGYENVREMCADVRLVLKNAMTYNDDRNDFHVMAKTLLDRFEEKWLQLLPKVIEEETRRKGEEAEAQRAMQLAQEAANAKMARELSNELYEADKHLDDLREMMVQKCRKMSVEEKRNLGSGLSKLSPEDLTKALEIIAQKNSSFEATAEEVDVDMDAQSESTLWRLKFFVRDALEGEDKSSSNPKVGNDNSKRKKEICDALAKTAKKQKLFNS